MMVGMDVLNDVLGFALEGANKGLYIKWDKEIQ